MPSPPPMSSVSRGSPSPSKRRVRATIAATASPTGARSRDRKSTRLNSSHLVISYAVFCLKKKNRDVSCGINLGRTLVHQKECPCTTHCLGSDDTLLCLSAHRLSEDDAHSLSPAHLSSYT